MHLVPRFIYTTHLNSPLMPMFLWPESSLSPLVSTFPYTSNPLCLLLSHSAQQCSSSYASAALGAVESLLALRSAPVFTANAAQPFTAQPLSVQQLLDCDTNNQGCVGGWPDYSWQFLTSNGLDSQGGYSAGPDSCNTALAAGEMGSISDFQYVPTGNENALKEVGGDRLLFRGTFWCSAPRSELCTSVVITLVFPFQKSHKPPKF